VAAVILLDTHLLVWLYAGELRRIPQSVQRRLNREQLALSPFAQLELGYLYEVGKVTIPAAVVVEELSARLELVLADVPAASICKAALDVTWTRDPFDRLLVAHATVTGLSLVTKDEMLRQHLPLAWWAD
jgi:PIN domain nuclease of toxin-antitoxin system